MSTIIMNSLAFYILSFKKWFGICAKYENLMNKIQFFKRPTNKTKKVIPAQMNLEQNLLHRCILKLKRNLPRLLEYQP